ncbi:hypothetical protein D9758_018142 [Tetrapyrgos nigripes]|uniref:DNA 3'-5' helicase n=1 Tax=Tetrapyrgos nigripes TaxID=182062 RepID=A0A8H5BW61_9AGAR|nr:hypothetical protein D9758_018142 [Tetrapyrgos nigripes]
MPFDSSLKRNSSESSDSSFSSKRFKPVYSNANGSGTAALEYASNLHEKQEIFIHSIISRNSAQLCDYFAGNKKGDKWSLNMIHDACTARLDTLKPPDNRTGEDIITREATPEVTGSDSVTNASFVSSEPARCNGTGEDDDALSDNSFRSRLQIALGVSSLRAVYLQALCSFMENFDVFVCTPRAGAKDLCLRIASVCRIGQTRRGTTIIVSPYDVLSADHISELKQNGIDVLLWTAGTAEVIRRLQSSDKPDVLCVTPEKLQDSSTLQSLLHKEFSAGCLARIAINDAHRLLMSEHTSRDAKYRYLHSLKSRFPGVPIMALTEQNTADAIEQALGLSNCARFSQTFSRNNLHYAVRSKTPQVTSAVIEYVSSLEPKRAGIIYCSTDQECIELTEQIARTHNARMVLTEMSPHERAQLVKDWQSAKYNILVITSQASLSATPDREDVRFIIHLRMPTSIQRYLEDTFPAGQDGLTSHCILIYSNADYRELASEVKAEEQNRVYLMAKYCENEFACRQALLLHTLGEDLQHACGKCDVCCNADLVVKKDFTKEAQDLVKLVQSFAESDADGVTSSDCRQLFKNQVGNASAGNQANLFGAGSHLTREEIDRLLSRLCFLGFLDEILAKEMASVFKPSFRLPLAVPKPVSGSGSYVSPNGMTINENESNSPLENSFSSTETIANTPEICETSFLVQLKALRVEFMRSFGYNDADLVLPDEILEQLNFMALKRMIREHCGIQDPQQLRSYVDEKWSKFGTGFLKLCVEHRGGGPDHPRTARKPLGLEKYEFSNATVTLPANVSIRKYRYASPRKP